ncbi:MAG: hypothetical protein P8074_07405 [Anaerolineales bacterium]
MSRLTQRFNYLFRSTRGLILVAIALIGLTSAFFGMLSGPMAEWGVRDVVVRLFNMDLVEAEREGRLIILYHTIAMVVVAIETYMITDLIPMTQKQQTTINATITAGYMLAVFFGLPFA